MKKIAFFLWMVSWLVAGFVTARKVEIYPGGARVYYVKKADAHGKVSFGPLPADASEIICSHPDFSIEEGLNPQIPERALKIKEEFQKLRVKDNSLKARMESLYTRHAFYSEALKNLSTSFSQKPVTGWEKLLEKFSSRVSSIREEIEKLKKERENLKPRLELARKRWKRIKSRVERAKFVEVRANPGDSVFLSFNTASISYRFFYRVNVSLNASKVTMEAFSRITSFLPVDIRGETLLLPERPSFYIPLPRQKRWEIYLKKTYPVKGRPKMKVAMGISPLSIGRRPEAIARTSGVYRTVYLGKNALKFGENNLKIFSKALDGKITWEVYPAVSTRVFVVFRGENNTGFHLPSARVLYFIDGVFTRADSLPSVAENQKLTLTLAVDPNFKVKYRRKTLERNQGIMKSGILIEREVNVINGGEKEREVHVYIPIPYPVDREIKLKAQMFPPPISVNRDKIGFWKLRIKAGREKKINLKFKLTFPKGKEISGVDSF